MSSRSIATTGTSSTTVHTVNRTAVTPVLQKSTQSLSALTEGLFERDSIQQPTGEILSRICLQGGDKYAIWIKVEDIKIKFDILVDLNVESKNPIRITKS